MTDWLGRTVDAVYCVTCGLPAGIYTLQLNEQRKKCPWCGRPATEQIAITILKGRTG